MLQKLVVRMCLVDLHSHKHSKLVSMSHLKRMHGTNILLVLSPCQGVLGCRTSENVETCNAFSVYIFILLFYRVNNRYTIRMNEQKSQ